LCGKPVREDDAVKVVADWKPDESGVFHAECWNAYEDGLGEQPDDDESVEASPHESSSVSDEPPPEEPSNESERSSPSWQRKGVLAALGLLVGAAVAVVILTSTSDSGTPTSPDAVILQSSLPSSSSEGLGAAIGQAAPRLVGTAVDGSPLTISPGGGARHAVVFLAHWCEPCQNEVREIVKLADGGQLNGIKVEAVVTATSPLRANYPPSKWLKGERWPYPTLADNSSRAAANAYGITSIPTVVLVGENAAVVARLGNLQNAGAMRTFRNFAAGR
jgi:thiol-disulfide isomerase/thioredoxin